VKKIFTVAAGDPPTLAPFLAARGVAGRVYVDGEPVGEQFPLRPGMRVVVHINDRASGAPRIVFEDEWLLVIDKPAGLASEGSRADLGVQGWAKGAHLVHRLDRDASGLMALLRRGSLTPEQMRRRYLARVPGPMSGEGEIRLRIARDGRDSRKRRALPEADPNGQSARTRWKALSPALLELELDTGRTHQIRVHLAAIGQPIDGDVLYGGAPAPRLMLHAHELSLPHPRDGRVLAFRSPFEPPA
jgi:23S rRNA-/tRNA-specific pseudouridylate synthase